MEIVGVKYTPTRNDAQNVNLVFMDWAKRITLPVMDVNAIEVVPYLMIVIRWMDSVFASQELRAANVTSAWQVFVKFWFVNIIFEINHTELLMDTTVLHCCNINLKLKMVSDLMAKFYGLDLTKMLFRDLVIKVMLNFHMLRFATLHPSNISIPGSVLLLVQNCGANNCPKPQQWFVSCIYPLHATKWEKRWEYYVQPCHCWR